MDNKDPERILFPIHAVNESFCLHIRKLGDILNLLTSQGFRVFFCNTPEAIQDFSKGKQLYRKAPDTNI
jgi:hypothetical protein